MNRKRYLSSFLVFYLKAKKATSHDKEAAVNTHSKEKTQKKKRNGRNEF
jgi:hypothetical protein